MNVIKALELVRDENAPFDLFIGALELVNLYRDGDCVVDYCHVLCDYIYIELDGITLFYLDMLFAV